MLPRTCGPRSKPIRPCTSPDHGPRGTPRSTPIGGIVLTGADLDQVLGIVFRCESSSPSSSTPRPWCAASSKAIHFSRCSCASPTSFTWSRSLRTFLSFSMRSPGTPEYRFPDPSLYAREFDTGEPGHASLGLVFESDGRRIADTPSLPAITDQWKALYESCDATPLPRITFWSDNELNRTDTHGALRPADRTPSHRRRGRHHRTASDGHSSAQGLCPHQQHQPRSGSRECRVRLRTRRRLGGSIGRMAPELRDRRTSRADAGGAPCPAAVRGSAQHHHRHPFHLRMHREELSADNCRLGRSIATTTRPAIRN